VSVPAGSAAWHSLLQLDVGEVSSGKRGRNPQFGDGDGKVHKPDTLNHRQQRARKLKDRELEEAQGRVPVANTELRPAIRQ
jgi:hypothetical protein